MDVGNHTITLDGQLYQSSSAQQWRIFGTGALSGAGATRILKNAGTLELDGITLRDGDAGSGVSPHSRAVDS